MARNKWQKKKERSFKMKPENCIFTPNAKNNSDPDRIENSDNQFFTILGNHDYIDKDNRPRTNNETHQTFAKSITKNNSTKFFIKTGTYGRIYNPMGMFSEGKENKFNAKIGKKEFEFKQVNQKIFDMYVNFLSTKNTAWLNNAEREFI